MPNGTNARNAVLKFLVDCEEQGPFTKDTICNQTSYSTDTIHSTMTSLRKLEFVSEVNGFWAITKTGKEFKENNPHADFKMFKDESSRENLTQLIVKEIGAERILQSAFLNSMPKSKHLLEQMIPILEEFVVTWLIARGELKREFYEVVDFPEVLPKDDFLFEVVRNLWENKD